MTLTEKIAVVAVAPLWLTSAVGWASVAVGWVLPGLLTVKLARLTIEQTHWVERKTGIYEGMHEWLEGMCPCGD